ncbi:MAG: DUF5615 family PIN-like protein [Chloroflexia bacterium]
MWRLALDQNFNEVLLRAVKQIHNEPDLDVVRLVSFGLSQAPDAVVLEWAARQGRILLTHDAKTIPPLPHARVTAGLAMPGVILVRRTAPNGAVIEDLCILLGASRSQEWQGRVERLPYSAVRSRR